MMSSSSEPVFPGQAPAATEWWQTTLNWPPTPTQVQQFQDLYEWVMEGNRHFNLTRITEPLEFLEKHLWDSLRGIQPFLQADHWGDHPEPSSVRVLDIGTGAGFPGVPVAIARPDWHITLADSTRKKLVFLDDLLAKLNLTNASTLLGRVEALGHYPAQRQQYDLALVRAVASATVCAEYALPFLKVTGHAVLYRGHWAPAEAATLEQAVQQLGGVIETVEAFQTPLTGGDRHCIYLRKVAPTPAAYPRAIGIPTQHPLGQPGLTEK